MRHFAGDQIRKTVQLVSKSTPATRKTTRSDVSFLARCISATEDEILRFPEMLEKCALLQYAHLSA